MCGPEVAGTIDDNEQDESDEEGRNVLKMTITAAPRTRLGAAMLMMLAGGVLTAGQAPDAKKVLADMHAAMGGADKVAAIKTLTAKGVTRRTTVNGTVENQVELFLALPDKYVMKTVVAGQGPMAVFRSAGFNGDGLIMATDAPPNLAEGMRSRLAGSDRSAGAAGAEQSPEEAAAIRARQLQNQQQEFARLTVGLLATSYAVFPLSLTCGGEAESGDGTAHIVNVRNGDFAATLYVDMKTSRPLMLSWTLPGAGANAGRTLEHRFHYADFKTVGGVTLPHTVRRSVDGQPTMEMVFETIVINPKIDPKIFEISK